MAVTASGIGSGNQESGCVQPGIISAFVELDVYSGQPNPHWKLSDKICKDVLEEISHLTPARTVIPRCNQLGYRGLKMITDVVPSGKREELYICGGYIFLYREGVESVFIDDNRQIEQKLLASGRQMQDQELGELISQILQTLPGSQQKDSV